MCEPASRTTSRGSGKTRPEHVTLEGYDVELRAHHDHPRGLSAYTSAERDTTSAA
jgi:hypothetical protein